MKRGTEEMLRALFDYFQINRLAAWSLALWGAVYPLTVFSDPVVTSPTAALRAEYTRLRNVDPETDDPVHREEWEILAKKISDFVSSSAAQRENARIRVDGADINLRLWRGVRQERLLERASALIQPLLDSAPQNREYFEAALMRGDIEVCAARSLEEAARWYRKALGTDRVLSRRAEQRLLGIKLNTFDHFVPAPEIEQPRLTRAGSGRSLTFARSIVLDPGHGGDDSGAVGAHNLLEKEVTLDLGFRVREILEREHGIRVVLTRSEDVFVPLARRTSIANNSGAKVFISLHTNASPSHELSGLETYYLDNTDDQAGRKLAERENSVQSGGELDDLSFIVSDLIQSGKIEDSIRLSRVVDESLRRRVLPVYEDGRSRGVKKAPFFVLVGAHMPCSLLELFFIDHQKDAQRLASDQFRDLLARSIAQGIVAFLQGAEASSAPAVVSITNTVKKSRGRSRARERS